MSGVTVSCGLCGRDLDGVTLVEHAPDCPWLAAPWLPVPIECDPGDEQPEGTP